MLQKREAGEPVGAKRRPHSARTLRWRRNIREFTRFPWGRLGVRPKRASDLFVPILCLAAAAAFGRAYGFAKGLPFAMS